MYDFIKKNIYLIFLFIITLSIGFLTFLTFIDKGFIKLSDQNLRFLLILNIILLIVLFDQLSKGLFRLLVYSELVLNTSQNLGSLGPNKIRVLLFNGAPSFNWG